MSNDLITMPAQAGDLDIMTLGKLLVESRYFQDAGQMAQAVVKVLAGRELGFGPIASMTGIHIVQGRPTLGADLLAKAVKRSGRYNYRVVELSDTRCELAFFERDGDKWTPIGTSPFTVEDARRAGTKNIDKFPRNMLFARAMSNGVKWFCPDAIGLTVYDPSELPADDGPALTMVDTSTGEIAPAQPVIAQAEPTNGAGNGHEPEPQPAYKLADGKRVAYLRIMCKTLYGAKADEMRAQLCEWASAGATAHSAELAEGEAERVIRELENRMEKRGFTRDEQGHWSKEPTTTKPANPHATLESSIARLGPGPMTAEQATADLFGDAS